MYIWLNKNIYHNLQAETKKACLSLLIAKINSLVSKKFPKQICLILFSFKLLLPLGECVAICEKGKVLFFSPPRGI